jgi:hypothetical protein
MNKHQHSEIKNNEIQAEKIGAKALSLMSL